MYGQYEETLRSTWEQMTLLAYEYGLTRLAWCMDHGIFDETDLNDRAIVRRRIATRDQ